MIIKVLSSEIALTNPSTVGLATTVRILNTGSAATITRKNSAETIIGTVTIAAGEIVYLEKDSSDTLEGGVSFKAVKIAYTI
jgi:hypothetical protein